jgi:phage terminase small subunit
MRRRPPRSAERQALHQKVERISGNSPAAALARYRAFAEAYLTNGQNATLAAEQAGYRGKRVTYAAWKLVRHPKVAAIIEARAREVSEAAAMSTENWARHLRAVAFADVGDLYGPDGKLLPIPELPAHVRAALTLVEMSDDGTPARYKFHPKGPALETMAKHLGLFEKDNAQTRPNILVKIELVG